VGLSAIGATAARHGLDDLDLFAGLFDQMADVDDTLVAGVGALEAGVVRLYGVVLLLGRWVRGCARLSRVHSDLQVCVGRVPGCSSTCGAIYVVAVLKHGAWENATRTGYAASESHTN
jgi:hypothetical protein